MKAVEDFSGDRHKAWCIQCGTTLVEQESNKDHVPSKGLLDKKYPAELPTVRICRACNSSFSSDEEYFIAFLGSVLAGTTDPDQQIVERAGKILSGNHRLQDEIEDQLQVVPGPDGQDQVSFVPDTERVKNVVVKNARGHVYFEHGQPAFGEPDHVAVVPLAILNDEQRSAFMNVDYGNVWPEVGSRMMTRLSAGHDLDDGNWVVVQPGVYRYAVIDDGRFIVRIILREYLAAEVIWEQ